MGVYSPTLEDADIQALSQTAPPLPVQTTIQKVLTGENDADLVSLKPS